MEELKNNKMFWVLVLVTVFNVGAFFLGKFIVDKAADRVIQKLQKEYSPSPYGPGLDPDKVNPDALKAQKAFFERKHRSDNKVFFEETSRTEGHIQKMADEANDWREGWEKSRRISQ